VAYALISIYETTQGHNTFFFTVVFLSLSTTVNKRHKITTVSYNVLCKNMILKQTSKTLLLTCKDTSQLVGSDFLPASSLAGRCWAPCRQQHISEIPGSLSSKYEDDCLLDTRAMKCCRNWVTLQSCLLPPLSRQWWNIGQLLWDHGEQQPTRQSSSSSRWCVEGELHGCHLLSVTPMMTFTTRDWKQKFTTV
jgi:hypothetical protein